jgi:nucleoside-diphosphate-sugar epimerase/SAM-dependent methyltransferase/quercetin dioxygenase-like cupin family protein
MKNIVITGGLGYIGSELCKIYSGYSRHHKITVIDNRFCSARINQLRLWNINFLHADILDKSKIKKIIFEADIVHHLAGITLVPKTKGETNIDIENKIKKNAIVGTQNILDCLNTKGKIIFPSTHVVYEGLKKIKLDIDENEKTCPVLSYSSSKNENEIQIKKSNKNFIILRLGTVYGFSGDSTRMDIMPNLFSQISSQDGKLNLFGRGKQIKSLVPLIDVARCFKFMEEKIEINKEIFNLTKEVVTVEQVAKICKKINPRIKLNYTDDEIPNLGFSLSNKKIKKLGFKFLYNLKNSIKEMIEKWSIQKIKKNIYSVDVGKDPFFDSRGKIINHELTEPINLIGYIESKKGTVRANHYHPEQEQKCIFTQGQIIEVYQDLLIKDSMKITQVVSEGEQSIIKPNVAHAMVFSKDTRFLNLVRGEREHKNYGITHTIKHILVDDNEKKMLLKYYKFNCRSCENNNLKRVVSLGYQPLANNLNNSQDKKTDLYPLELNFCDKCFNCQLSVAIDQKKMFSNYLYTSSTSKSFRKHFENAAKKYLKEFNLNSEKSYIIDIGSNDGVALKPFKNLGFKNILGIEPAKNLAREANKEKIKTFNGFLNKRNLKKIKKGADLILASNVFAHADNLREMAECMIDLLKDKGTLIIEVQYLLNTIKDLSFDNIYHEHYNYWSLTSLNLFFNKYKDIKLLKVEKVNTHGGSIRVYFKKNRSEKINNSVLKMLNDEQKFGIHKFKTYQKFAKDIYNLKRNFLENIDNLLSKNNELIAYGAPAKATTALNFFGMKNKIKFIIEDNPLKHNKFIPGVNIPIYSKKIIKNKQERILVLAWNFFNEIKKNNSNLSNKFINLLDLTKPKRKNVLYD